MIIYRHIRNDTNTPFYIGMGSTMSRPYSKRVRNSVWKEIVSKTDYEVEILFDDLPLEEAKEKEREFIAIYGRLDKGTGTLANQTVGGDGFEFWGALHSDISKRKMSVAKIDKKRAPHSDETKRKISLAQSGKASEQCGMYGKKHTDEAKRKIGMANSLALTGRRWYTDGTNSKQCFPGTEPLGFYPSRTITKLK